MHGSFKRILILNKGNSKENSVSDQSVYPISRTQKRRGGGGKFLTVPVCQEIKSYEKILGELQNTCKNEKKNKKQPSVQSRVKRLIASRRLNLIKAVSFHFRSSVQFLVVLKIASFRTDQSMSYFSDFYSVMTVRSRNLT